MREEGQARGMEWSEKERREALYSSVIKPLTDYAEVWMDTRLISFSWSGAQVSKRCQSKALDTH